MNNNNFAMLLSVLLLLLTLPACAYHHNQQRPYHGITYNLNKGRLGDHMLTVIKALYAAEQIKRLYKDHSIKFIYKQFPFSDLFNIHTLAQKYNREKHSLIPTKKINSLQDVHPNDKNESLIYVTDLKFQIAATESFNRLHAYILANKNFYMKLKNLFQPIVPIATINCPKDTISVAVHLRSGYGYDKPLLSKQIYKQDKQLVTYTIWTLYDPGATLSANPEVFSNSSSSSSNNSAKTTRPLLSTSSQKNDIVPLDDTELCPIKKISFLSPCDWKEVNYEFSDLEHPTRFPPLQFYIDQIKFLHKNLNGAPLFIHIFTDHPKPEKLVTKIKDQINIENITYSYREENNSHNSNILDDLFAMMEFDCLIRPGSSYSKVAQLMGNHKVIIYPAKTSWLEEKKLLVNEVGVIFKAG